MTQEHKIDAAILALSPQAMIYADREGLIRRWNDAAEALFGHSAEHVMGQSLDIIIPEHLREAHWRGFNRAMDSGEPRLGTGFIRTKALHAEGNSIYVELSFRLIKDEDGKVLGTVAFCRD